MSSTAGELEIIVSILSELQRAPTSIDESHNSFIIVDNSVVRGLSILTPSMITNNAVLSITATLVDNTPRYA